MKKLLYILLSAFLLSAAMPTMAAPQKKKPTAAQIAKQKEAEKKQKEAAKKRKAAEKKKKEAEKVKAQKEAEKARLKEAYYRQEAEKSGKEKPKEKPIHYVNLAPRLGYSAMLDNLKAIDTEHPGNGLFMDRSLKGGLGAGLHLGYNLEYKHFLFETGITFDYLTSKSTYAFTQVRHENSYNADYYYTTDRLSESRSIGYLSLPLLVGGQFGSFYFLVGPRIGYGLFGSSRGAGIYDITVQDPALHDPYGLGIQHFEPIPKGPGTLRVQPIDLRACVELGLDLDKWLQAQPDKKKMKSVKPGQRIPFGKEHLHYRIGLFAEYAATNSNATPVQHMPLAFDQNNSNGKYLNSVLASATDEANLFGTQGNRLNNLFVGAKFTLQFEIPGKTQRPIPPPPSYLNVRITDSETGELLKTSILTVTDNNSHKQVVKPKELTRGMVRQRLNIGSYTADISCDDYYGQTIAFTIDSVDQMLDFPVRLIRIPKAKPVEVVPEQVEKGETFVMRNLYFATNRTRILDASEPALQELADYMKRHPEVRLRIIGHTDNVGSERANQHLSEGRAEAVRDALVERGVAKDRLEAEGRGEREPIDTNETEEGRQNNRRVVLEIL